MSTTGFTSRFGEALGERISAMLDTPDIERIMTIVGECAQEIKDTGMVPSLTVEGIRNAILEGIASALGS